METINITSISGKGNFKIEEEGKEIVEVTYQDWFSSKATYRLNGNDIMIKPRNIWWSKFDMFKNERDIGDIIFNWKGDVIIRVNDQSKKEENYLLKAKGFWNFSFDLIDEQNNVVLGLKPSINWKKMNYNYEVKIANQSIEHEKLVELIAYSGYSANLYMTMTSAAATAAI